MKEYLEWIKELIKAPIETLTFLIGVIFMFLSFSSFSYDNRMIFKLQSYPNWYLLIIGVLLL